MNPIIHQRENNSSDPLQFEFYFSEIDTAVLVQTAKDCVVIRTTTDSFSERRRERFVHELALEGFIADRFCHYRAGDHGVIWTVDRSWKKQERRGRARTSQLAGVVGACCGLLLLLVLAVSGVYSATVRRENPTAKTHSSVAGFGDWLSR